MVTMLLPGGGRGRGGGGKDAEDGMIAFQISSHTIPDGE